jgi:hypothetical protein
MDHRKLAASLAASLLVASSAMAATRTEASDSRIASDFAAWAGGHQNAQALVAGLHNGTSITLATPGPNRTMSLAGFTPNAPMSYEEVRSALAAARSELSRLGVRHPTAEQIQAALIGGEVELGHGRTRMLPGTVAVLGGNPNVAAR